MNNHEEQIMKVLEGVPRQLREELLIRCVCSIAQEDMMGTLPVNQIYQLGKLESRMITQMQNYFAASIQAMTALNIQPVDKKGMH